MTPDVVATLDFWVECIATFPVDHLDLLVASFTRALDML